MRTRNRSIIWRLSEVANGCTQHAYMNESDEKSCVRFSTRGRFTLPAALRRKYGIKGGVRVQLEVTATGLVFKLSLAKPVKGLRRGRPTTR